jgi:hypothetical protein
MPLNSTIVFFSAGEYALPFTRKCSQDITDEAQKAETGQVFKKQ